MARKASSELRQQWRGRLRRFARSKLSVAEFCRREKVSEPSFYQWRKKLTQVDGDLGTTTFVPVEVASASPMSLQVAFPNGSTLSLGVEDPRLLQVAIETIALARTISGEA